MKKERITNLLKEHILIAKKSILSEAVNVNFDIDQLEKLYSKLTPTLKEILPANIKEWIAFTNQAKRLLDLFQKVKRGDTSMISFNIDKEGFSELSNKIRQYVRGSDNFKHSLSEVLLTIETNGSLKRYFKDYLYQGDIDIEGLLNLEKQIADMIWEMAKEQLKLKKKEEEKSRTSQGDLVVDTIGKAKEAAKLPEINSLDIKSYKADIKYIIPLFQKSKKIIIDQWDIKDILMSPTPLKDKEIYINCTLDRIMEPERANIVKVLLKNNKVTFQDTISTSNIKEEQKDLIKVKKIFPSVKIIGEIYVYGAAANGETNEEQNKEEALAFIAWAKTLGADYKLSKYHE